MDLGKRVGPSLNKMEALGKMKELEHYTDEMDAISRKADESKGVGGGHMAWVMMIVGVVVTGTMTYSLTHEGMKSSSLWVGWVDVAAFLPVGLLEGSAIALVYGRHHWFRSAEQRGVAKIAGWSIWIILAATSVVHFALGKSDSGVVHDLMAMYASYVLPLVIVAIPMLWKHLYDAAPESATRTAVLEAESDLRSELVRVRRQQDQMMVEEYRKSLTAEPVKRARAALFNRAAIHHAEQVSGFIEAGAEEKKRPMGFPTRGIEEGKDETSWI